MLEPRADQGESLRRHAPQASSRLITLVSQGDSATEQPLLWQRSDILDCVVQVQPGCEVPEEHGEHDRHHVEHHLAGEFPAFLVIPRPAERGFPPRHISCGNRAIDRLRSRDGPDA